MSDFKPGEIVDITITGVRLTDTSPIRIAIEDERGETWVLPPQAAVTRVAPAEWPPRPGDLWRTERQPYFAMVDNGELVMVNLGGERFNPDVVLTFAPLTLVHREDTTDWCGCDTVTHDGRGHGATCPIRTEATS